MKAETRQGMQEMEEFLYKFLWSYLQSLGLFREKHAILTNLREQAGISISYERWLQGSIMLLEQKHYLHCREHAPDWGCRDRVLHRSCPYEPLTSRKPHSDNRLFAGSPASVSAM